MLANKNLGIAVTAVAVLAGLMIGGAGPSRAQDKEPAKPAGPQWKDNAEYQLADAALKEADPAKKLADLDKWKAGYPTTEYLNARQDMYLGVYVALNQPRQAFDEAQAILKDRPNDFQALIQSSAQVTLLKPPSAADLDAAQKAADLLMNNPDTVFAPANKPANLTDAQWTQAKAQTKPFAETQLIAIYGLRKDDKRAVDDLTKLLQKDPGLAMASYQLGRAMLAVVAAEKKPENQPPALYQIARAVSVDGPGALPAQAKQQVQTFLTGAYKTYHGSDAGLTDLLATAKANPFPPAGFTIDSTVDIATKQEAARQAEIAKDPLMYLWAHTIKEALAMQGDSFFDANVKDFALPPPDDKTTPPTPQYFKAHIISMMPATRPKEITVGIEKTDIADAKLEFETALPGKMDVGEVIEFKGVAKDWSHDPKNIVITFDVDAKEGLNGTWTGKNAPARGPARGKAAPKQ